MQPLTPRALPSSSPPSPTATATAFPEPFNTDPPVDEAQLRRAAASGVPPALRPRVWNLLLGISDYHTPLDPDFHQTAHRQYHTISAAVNEHDHDVLPSRIRRVLKRSRTVYQPVATHNARPQPHGSSSGDSLDGDTNPDQSPDAPLPSTPLSSTLSASHRSTPYPKASHRPAALVIDRAVQSTFVRVITSYLHTTNGTVDFHDDMVYLCAPFIEVMPTEADAFHAFRALMQSHSHMYTDDGLKHAVADFNLIFRTVVPRLYEKFVLEEVNINHFVRKWLRGLLVHQLPRASLLRLWDSYFANWNSSALTLHPYVCIVFIKLLEPELEECEDSERILALLSKLPPIDTHYVTAHALVEKEHLREMGVV